MAGDAQWKAEVVPKLQAQFPYERWQESSSNPVFIHTGRAIKIDKRKKKAYFTQVKYVKSLRRIYLDKKDSMKNVRPLEHQERTALRAGFGKINWIVRGCDYLVND